jgi:redox-sensitive bicupin YhaK (pirin superfamily)
MIIIRKPTEIFQIEGNIENGTFTGRWHFSFDQYRDAENTRFGTLRVFNDDILSPGAVWPLHPHREIEVVTYCAAGEFLHADEHGAGGILRKGWVQHTTIGRGMYHSEINNRPNEPMRFIQMWFLPSERGLPPALEQKKVKKQERANQLLPLVSNSHKDALPIQSEAMVFSSFLEANRKIRYDLQEGWGIYLYVLEGGPIRMNGHSIENLGAAKISELSSVEFQAEKDSELLLVDTKLI